MNWIELINHITRRTPHEVTTYLHEADDGTYISTQTLAADGIQDSDAVDTTATNTDVTIFQAALTGPADSLKRRLKGLFFSIESFLRAVSSATADVSITISAKNASTSTWVVILAKTNYANIGLAYLSKPFTGHIHPVANLDEWPIDIKIEIQSDELNEGRGKVRNTSLVTARFK